MLDFTKIILKSFLWCLFLDFVCSNFSKIYWGYNYELSASPDRAWHAILHISTIFYNPISFWRSYCVQEFMPGVINMTFAAVGLLSYKFLTSKCTTALNLLVKAKPFCKIRLAYFNHRLARNICLGIVQLLTLLALADTLGSLTWYASHDLAHLIDGFGNYELGERVFSLRTEDDLGRTLASTCGSYNGHDRDKKEVESERLNKCVAVVYGSQSLQMANRYGILAGHLKQQELPAESAKYRRKAVQLYKQLNKPDCIIENLGFLAFDQTELGDKDGAKNSINEAIAIIDIMDALWSTKLESLRRLYPAAWEIDKKWAEDIRSGRVLKRRPQDDKKHFMGCLRPKKNITW